MAQTMIVQAEILEKILSRLDKLSRDVHTIKTKLAGKEPPYGSPAWWEWSDKKAMEDIKQGRVTTISNKQELRHFLNSLKSA